MVKCFVCGAENDPDNRFCDQCGARLDTAEIAVGKRVDVPVPSVELTCSVCGAPVLPGQVFCDSCGADLRINPPVKTATSPAPEDTPPDSSEATPTPLSGAESTPPRSDSEPEATTAPPLPAPPVPTTDQEETVVSPAPEEETVAAAAASTETSAPVVPTTPTPAPAVVQPVLDREAERTRVEEEITRHQNTIAQMEQILQGYPAGQQPPYLTAALEDARQALAKAEAELATLPMGPDPAEVARLEEEITRHQNTITQMQQILQAYPSGAAPSYLTAAMEDARQAMTQAETALAAVWGNAPASTGASAPPPAAQPGEVVLTPTQPEAAAPPTEAPPVPAVGDQAAPVSSAGNVTLISEPTSAPTSTPTPAAVPSHPRLIILDGGHEVVLPVDKVDIIIGREDPVSHIFPEIDLTPFGGETGGVSRQHARLSHANNQWTVTDLNSTNYTRVNGSKLPPNVPTPIHDGVRLQFGRVVAILKL